MKAKIRKKIKLIVHLMTFKKIEVSANSLSFYCFQVYSDFPYGKLYE